MAQGRSSRVAKRVWRFTKWAVGWPVAFIGLVGLPDALNSWIGLFNRIFAWIGAIMTDPRVLYLAAKAVAVADFVNQVPVRVALVIVGVAILIWGWRPFWNLRHRVKFAWRTLLGEETWIGREEALKLIRASDWAQLREPSMSILGGFALSGGLSEYQRDKIRFGRFMEMTLESFEANRPQAVREVEGQKQYAEGRLRSFMAHALDAEAIEKFGKIPT